MNYNNFKDLATRVNLFLLSCEVFVCEVKYIPKKSAKCKKCSSLAKPHPLNIL
jgi:hypothetical protein